MGRAIFASVLQYQSVHSRVIYRGADKSLARPASRYILFDGENISFYASLVIYINSINVPPIIFINRIYENQIPLSL
jgi:homoserine trans-succinylase